jgi:hypothetical protein
MPFVRCAMRLKRIVNPCYKKSLPRTGGFSFDCINQPFISLVQNDRDSLLYPMR